MSQEAMKEAAEDMTAAVADATEAIADAVAPPPPKATPKAAPARNYSMSPIGAVQMLNKVREPLIELQDARGFSRDEDYTFINLLKALFEHTYNAAVNICTMLYNLLPLFDGFLYFLRFILDKLIDILETSDFQEKIIKSLVFTGEVIVLFLVIFFITSILVFPLVHLAMYFVRKILNVALGR